MPKAEYAPKLEYLDILVKMFDISELVDVMCVGTDRCFLHVIERMCVKNAVCFTVIFIFLGILIFLQVNFVTFIKRLLFFLLILHFNITY